MAATIFILALQGCAQNAPALAIATPTRAGASPSLSIATTAPTIIPLPTATPMAPAITPTSVTEAPVATEQMRARCPAGAESCLLDWPFPLQRPIQPPGTDQADASYRYGATQDGARQPHHGLDLNNVYGTPVYAAADGVAVVAGSDIEALVSPWPNYYGNVVVLEHHLPGVDEPVYTLYGHLSRVDVSVGERVTVGKKIGEVGASGVALGSHLHFEVRLGADDYASSRNPELWLAPTSLRLRLSTGQLAGAAPGGIPGGLLAVRVADAKGKLIPTVVNVQYFADPAGPVTQTLPVEVYDTREQYPVNSDNVLGESFVLGNLPAGHYRLAFVYWGALYERWVEVVPGRLTYSEFALK